MLTPRAIATIILFLLSTIFVIQPMRIQIIPKKGKYFTLNLLTAPTIAIMILWAAQCINASTIRDALVGKDGVKPHNILIPFFSLAYTSITLDETGVFQGAAHWVSNMSGKRTAKLYVKFYILVTVLSAVLGNGPVILPGTLFLLHYTKANNVWSLVFVKFAPLLSSIGQLDALPWLMSVFAATNTASMILSVGNPTNVMICEGFGIENAPFTAYTILPFVVCSATCLLALYFQNRVSGKLLPELTKPERFNIRNDIKDPVCAVVGSVLLGGLLTAPFVHLSGVDVWVVTLPFAGAKLVFDIVWDIYGLQQPRRSDDSASPPMPMQIRRTYHARASDDFSCQTSIESSSYLDIKGGAERPSTIESRWKTFDSLTKKYLPTLHAAFPRLPFALVPFALSQFILIEALAFQGWIDLFARWLSIASRGQMFSAIWITGVTGVILCNIAGTNIGATLLLTNVVRAANLPAESTRAASIALVVASNIGAVSFVFSASLPGLLWSEMIANHPIVCSNQVRQWTFAKWNLLPLLVMTIAGLGIVSAEMAYIYKRHG